MKSRKNLGGRGQRGRGATGVAAATAGDAATKAPPLGPRPQLLTLATPRAVSLEGGLGPLSFHGRSGMLRGAPDGQLCPWPCPRPAQEAGAPVLPLGEAPPQHLLPMWPPGTGARAACVPRRHRPPCTAGPARPSLPRARPSRLGSAGLTRSQGPPWAAPAPGSARPAVEGRRVNAEPGGDLPPRGTTLSVGRGGSWCAWEGGAKPPLVTSSCHASCPGPGS